MSVSESNDEFDESTAVFNVNSLVPPQSAGTARHVLVRMDGSDIGRVIGLGTKPEFLVGRRRDCDLVLNYEGVSRRHARLYHTGGRYFLEDLGSSNGTVVNRERVGRHQLEDGDLIQFGPRVSVRYSVTDAKEEKVLRQLYEASVRDSLTGAYNREYLAVRLRTEIAFATRNKTNTAVVMFDLDHFKAVNDRYGHQAGDAVLIDVVRSANLELREEDILSRYGGEEFAISLRGVDSEGARVLGERIRQNSHRGVEFQGQEIPISISVGCASLADCSNPSPEGLIQVADRRLYAAKAGGRNRVVAAG